MKKLMALLGLIFISCNSYASTISIPPFVSGNDVTIPALEYFRSTVQNTINGGIAGGGVNITPGSITSQDEAQSVSIVTFRSEAFNDFTYTGMLPATSVNLTSTISAGTSYVKGVRVTIATTNHGYNASKDTYTYINSGGFLDYVEVANGGAAPSTPANDLLLAKVVTNGTAVTGVTDLRTTSIQITVNGSNFPADYRNQALFVRDSTTTGHLNQGSIALGTSLYSNIAATSSKSTGSASNWIEGNVPTQANLKYYTYAYNSSGSSFDFKYSSADPVYSDTSLNNAGTLQYYTSGGTTYRAMSWISNDSAGSIQTYNYSQFPSATTTNKVSFLTGAVATGTTAIPNDDTIPQITEGDQYMAVPFRPSNANDTLKISVVFNGTSSADNRVVFALFQDNIANALAVGQTFTSSGTVGTSSFNYYMTAATTSLINFKVRAGGGGGAGATTTFNGEGGARKFGGVMPSSISVEESAS